MLNYQKQQVKKEVKHKMVAGIDKKELVLLKLTAAQKQTQLNWEHAKEFEYQGEMYDVIETEIRCDTTYYWCWWDHAETALNKQLDELASLVKGNHAKHKENQKRLYDFFKSLYLPEVAERKPFVLLEIKVTNFWKQIYYSSLAGAPSVPPPEVEIS
ncbi:MAG: hypothetical protein HC892_11820 [Saprospiraceae bacterium]|nr:hypothetical protein [Saprospiraceae bacterium]